jgi:hypothetical protein
MTEDQVEESALQVDGDSEDGTRAAQTQGAVLRAIKGTIYFSD